MASYRTRRCEIRTLLVVTAALVALGSSCADDPRGASSVADAPPSLLEQLAARPDVREHLFLRTEVPGLVLCGTAELGRSTGADPGTEELYLWVECASYRTGPDAESLSGGADPAVATVRGDQLVGVEFPPLHYTPDQLADLFPPDVVERLRSGRPEVSPTEEERLAVAATTS